MYAENTIGVTLCHHSSVMPITNAYYCCWLCLFQREDEVSRSQAECCSVHQDQDKSYGRLSIGRYSRKQTLSNKRHSSHHHIWTTTAYAAVRDDDGEPSLSTCTRACCLFQRRDGTRQVLYVNTAWLFKVKIHMNLYLALPIHSRLRITA